MSLLDKFKDQFVDRDDEDMEEEDLGEETAPVNPAQPVPPRPAAVRGIGRSAVPRQAAKPYTMVVVSPKSYSDAEKIGDHLKAMRPVVMNMEKTDADEAQRIVDFVQGIMYALDGRIDQISESIYLCAPNNMSVSRENFAAYADQQAAAPAGAPQWNAQQPQGGLMSFWEGGLGWLKKQFNGQDEDVYDTQAEEREILPEAGALPARSLRPLEVVIMVPGTYADARHGVDALEKGLAVIVVLNDSVDDETASRFVDFMSGAVYLAHGSIETVRLDKDRLTDFQGIPAWKGPNL